MINSVSKTAIKLALIQTVPGEEFNVRNRLKKACDNNEHVERAIFLKGLGSFDIILAYLTNDFGYHLSKAGPIDNILKSNLLLCYSYLSSDVHKMFDSIESNGFVGFSLLKISPGVQQRYNPEFEKLLRKHLSSGSGWFLIGSLGWNEMILLISDDDLSEIAEQLLSIANVGIHSNQDEQGPIISVLIKTLSFLGIHYKYMPDFDIKKSGFKRTKEFLEQNVFLKSSCIQINRRDNRNVPVIEVSTKPMYTDKIKTYFSGKGFQSFDLLGKQDLLLVPSKDMPWSHFIASVLYFRHEYKGKVLSTNIRLRSDIDIREESKTYKELKLKIPSIRFTFEQLRSEYNDVIAAGLSNSFYSFNAMTQNPVCGSAFIDMVDYPQYILDAGPQMPNKLEFAHVGREVIRYGAELRSYGTFESIEEVTGKFSELRGGCQRALLAVEYLPNYVFREIGEQWSGFVITNQSNKFDHVNEVIRVPTDTLWKPQKWWALYHEIGHILIENRPDFIEKHLIDEFLRNRTYQEHWTKLILELAAELVGFEIGFFGNYNLFFKLFWKHIVEIDPLQREAVPIQTYALRSFFTKIFLGCFRNYRGVQTIDAKDFTNLQYLYNNFMEHLEEIKKTTDNALKQTYTEDCFLAAENVKALQDLYPIANGLSKKILGIPSPSRPSSEQKQQTKSILKRLNAGKIWWEEISCPQAVIYHLIQDDLVKEQEVGFSKRIATVLTFWNQQMILIGKRFR